MITEKRTELIRDLEFWYAKLDKPVDPFGTGEKAWELQIRTKDESKAKELKEKYYLSMKKVDDDGDEVYWKANLKRKETNKDGNPLEPPVVVNGNKQPIDAGTIGNGSTGNLILFQYPYDVAGRKGVASQISRVQVIDYKVWTPNTAVDFDVVDAPSNETAQVDF